MVFLRTIDNQAGQIGGVLELASKMPYDDNPINFECGYVIDRFCSNPEPKMASAYDKYSRDYQMEEQQWWHVILARTKDNHFPRKDFEYLDQLYYVTPDVHTKFKDYYFKQGKRGQDFDLSRGKPVEFVADSNRRVIFLTTYSRGPNWWHSVAEDDSGQRELNIFEEFKDIWKVRLDVVVSPGRDDFLVDMIHPHFFEPIPTKELNLVSTDVRVLTDFVIEFTWTNIDLYKPEGILKFKFDRWTYCSMPFDLHPHELQIMAPWNRAKYYVPNDNGLIHSLIKRIPTPPKRLYLHWGKSLRFEAVPFDHRVEYGTFIGKKRGSFCNTFGGFMVDKRRVFSRDAMYERILCATERPFSDCDDKMCVNKVGRLLNFRMLYDVFTRSYYVNKNLRPWHPNDYTFMHKKIIEPNGKATYVFDFEVLPTEFPGLYYNPHATFISDPYGKLKGHDLINNWIKVWARYTPTSRLGRFEVVDVRTDRFFERRHPNLKNVYILMLTGGRVYAPEYVHYTFKFNNHLERIYRNCHPGKRLVCDAKYDHTSGCYVIDYVFRTKKLQPVEVAKAKDGKTNAYLIKLKAHPINRHVFYSRTYGLVEDPEGLLSEYLAFRYKKVRGRTYYHRGMARKRAPTLKTWRLPKIPKAPKPGSDEEDIYKSVRADYENYEEWYNKILLENATYKHRPNPRIVGEKKIAYRFHRRNYAVWCIENSDKYGTPLRICPALQMPVNGIFKDTEKNIVLALVDFFASKYHKRKDFRDIMANRRRNHHKRNEEAYRMALHILKSTGVSAWYRKNKNLAEDEVPPYPFDWRDEEIWRWTD